jgi:hypothetical protein
VPRSWLDLRISLLGAALCNQKQTPLPWESFNLLCKSCGLPALDARSRVPVMSFLKSQITLVAPDYRYVPCSFGPLVPVVVSRER